MKNSIKRFPSLIASLALCLGAFAFQHVALAADPAPSGQEEKKDAPEAPKKEETPKDEEKKSDEKEDKSKKEDAPAEPKK